MPAQYPGIGYPPDSQVGLLRKLVNNTALIATVGTPIAWVAAPAAANSPGTAGQVAYDASYLYVYSVAAGGWIRTPLSSW